MINYSFILITFYPHTLYTVQIKLCIQEFDYKFSSINLVFNLYFKN